MKWFFIEFIRFFWDRKLGTLLLTLVSLIAGASHVGGFNKGQSSLPTVVGIWFVLALIAAVEVLCSKKCS